MKPGNLSNQKGLSLIECSIALVITMIGVLGAAGLIAVGMRLQVESREATAANAYARAKVEQLVNATSTSAERAAGGSVTSNVTGYNDLLESRYRRRWLIENPGSGVPTKTQRLTVVVESAIPDSHMPTIRLTALLPAS